MNSGQYKAERRSTHTRSREAGSMSMSSMMSGVGHALWNGDAPPPPANSGGGNGGDGSYFQAANAAGNEFGGFGDVNIGNGNGDNGNGNGNGNNRRRWGGVVDIKTTAELESAVRSTINSNTMVVLLVHALKWCPPCKQLHPLFTALPPVTARGVNLTLMQADADEADELADKLGVTKLPTLVLFAGGRQVGFMAGGGGARSTQDLLSFIDRH